MLIFFKWRS